MLAGGKLMGVLSVSAPQRRRPFTRGQVQALSILTNLAATALENVTLYMHVRQSEERFRSITESAMDAIIHRRERSHSVVEPWGPAFLLAMGATRWWGSP